MGIPRDARQVRVRKRAEAAPKGMLPKRRNLVDLPFSCLPACVRVGFLGRQLMNDLHCWPPCFLILFHCLTVSLSILLYRSIIQSFSQDTSTHTSLVPQPRPRQQTSKAKQRVLRQTQRQRPRQQPVRVSRVRTKRPSSASSFPVASLPRSRIIIPLANSSRSIPFLKVSTSCPLSPHHPRPPSLATTPKSLLSSNTTIQQCFLQYPPSL